MTLRPKQPSLIKCGCYFQQLLYQRKQVTTDMAESMVLEDLQLDAVELGEKEGEGCLGAQFLDTVTHVQPHAQIMGKEKGPRT